MGGVEERVRGGACWDDRGRLRGFQFWKNESHPQVLRMVTLAQDDLPRGGLGDDRTQWGVESILHCVELMKRHVLIFGVVGGLLIVTLQYTEYRFVVIEHSVELYSGLVAILFAAFGIWLGLRITRRRETVVVKEVIVQAVDSQASKASPGAPVPFLPDMGRQQSLGITPREMEILTLVARGLSNREIAAELFVSENTVKTHCARAFDKLGAARRTQAVQRGKELGLLP